MKKDMILHTIAKQLVRNWRTRALSAAHSSSLTSALTQGRLLSADEITAHSSRDYGSCLTRLRLVVTLLLMMVLGVIGVKGATITYHIINLGRLDDNGVLTSNRTEALQFTSTSTTVGVPDKYKSPLAKNWKYYTSDEITETIINSKTTYTFAATTTLVEGTTEMSDGDHVYVTYELDKEKFREVGIYNRGIYKIRFPNKNGNNYYYLRQSTWYNDKTKETEINTDSNADESDPNSPKFLWKFNIVDPYQITIQSQSTDYLNHYLSSKTNNTTFSDIRLQPTLGNAKGTKAWAFSLLNGGADGTYRLIVTDGSTVVPDSKNNKLDSYGHGYLNNKRDNYKTTYHLYNQTNYDRCDLTIEPVTKNYIIVNNSGEPLVQALTEANTLEVPDVIKSPLASYTYYGTQQDAINEGTQLTSATGATIYVRYTTNNEVLNLKEEIKYNISVGGTNYLYASDATTLSSEVTSDNNAEDNHKWILTGNDAYQIAIKNVGNSKEIAYNLSSSEAVYLSGTGSKFFFHQTNSGEYEVVAITSNDYSTPDYYTLGMGAGNLKLYSNSGHPFGNATVQTLFTPRPMAAITTPPAANSLNYNGLNQELVTAGTASNGTMKYRLGDTGSYETSIPAAKDVNTYSVYYMAVGTDGYEDFFASEPIEVTINKQSIIVSGITASDKIYDGNTTTTLVYANATLTGKVGGEDISVTADGAFADANVGTGKIVNISGLTLGGADLGNYELATSGQQIETTADIYAKAVAITANNASKDYDGMPLTESGFTATALEEGDTHTFTVTMTTESTITNAGSQPNVIAVVDNVAVSTGVETPVGNYLVTTSNGLLTISRVAVTVTADNQTKGFGDPDPELTWTASGLKGSDTKDVLTVSISRAEGENVRVDPYIITPSGDEEQGNYNVTYNTGTLTITKKSLNEGTELAEGITIEITKSGDAYVPVVKHNGTTITEGTGGPSYDYSLLTSGSPSSKYYEVTIEGANNYSGSVTVKYANYKSGKKDTTDETENWSGTFVSDSGDGDFAIPSGMAAYKVTGVSDNAVEVEELAFIPEGEPVLLLSDDFAYCFVVKAKEGEGTTDTSGNLLEKATETESLTPAQIYILYNGEFVLNAAGTLAVGKVYLPKSAITGSAPAPARLLIRSRSGLSSIKDAYFSPLTTPHSNWYTLDGRRLIGKPTRKGLYLQNGQKVVVK